MASFDDAVRGYPYRDIKVEYWHEEWLLYFAAHTGVVGLYWQTPSHGSKGDKKADTYGHAQGREKYLTMASHNNLRLGCKGRRGKLGVNKCDARGNTFVGHCKEEGGPHVLAGALLHSRATGCSQEGFEGAQYGWRVWP